MDNSILVSCTVLAYNSSKTILDTLESIKAQTYSNIELIISDDGSKDETVNICREWIRKNGSRFVRTELLTVEKNTGITANCNRVWRVCRGEWMKGCAADDMLLPNCVEDYIAFVREHPNARWVVSQIRRYNEIFDDRHCTARNFVSTRELYDLPVEEQLKKIAITNTISATAIFCQLSLVREMNGYDSNYSFEDWPFNVKVLEHGYKIYLLDKETVCYRFHDSSSQSSQELFHTGLLIESRRFQQEMCLKHLSVRQQKGIKAKWAFQDFLINLNLNKRKPVISQFYYAGLAIIKYLYKL